MALTSQPIGIPIGTMGIKTSFPLAYPRGVKGDEGFRGFPLSFAFSSGAPFGPVSYKEMLRNVGLDVLASMWFDNSQSSVPMVVTFNGTYISVQSKASQQGFYPILALPNVLDITIQSIGSPTAAGVVSFLFLNKEALPLTWPSQ